MPIYVYKCLSCDTRQEEIKPISLSHEKYGICIFCNNITEKVPASVNMRIGSTVRQNEIKQIEEDKIMRLTKEDIKVEAEKNRKYRQEEKVKEIRKSVEQTVQDFTF